MRVGSLVMYAKGDNKRLVGTLGVAIEEYYSDSLEMTCFRVLWLETNGVGNGWSGDDWGLEVLCE